MLGHKSGILWHGRVSIVEDCCGTWVQNPVRTRPGGNGVRNVQLLYLKLEWALPRLAEEHSRSLQPREDC